MLLLKSLFIESAFYCLLFIELAPAPSSNMKTEAAAVIERTRI